MNIFEQATRLKIRFDTSKGQIGVEDLWDLPLISLSGKTNLDDNAPKLNAELRTEYRTSFVLPEAPKNDCLRLMFDVVLHILNTKVAEQKASQEAAAIREKKQKIMAIIEQKQDESLSAASLEDLQAMLASL